MQHCVAQIHLAQSPGYEISLYDDWTVHGYSTYSSLIHTQIRGHATVWHGTFSSLTTEHTGCCCFVFFFSNNYSYNILIIETYSSIHMQNMQPIANYPTHTQTHACAHISYRVVPRKYWNINKIHHNDNEHSINAPQNRSEFIFIFIVKPFALRRTMGSCRPGGSIFEQNAIHRYGSQSYCEPRHMDHLMLANYTHELCFPYQLFTYH